MDILFNFIESQCTKYNIDESHGVKHAKGTMLKADDILHTMRGVTADERRMALYAAALHDICDSKYTDVEKASKEIWAFLLDTLGWSTADADSLIAIVTTMSYSKLKALSEHHPIIYPDHGKWRRAYHVARNADLLEGFIVARAYTYNRRIHPESTEEQHWKQTESIFDKRIFKYLNEGWIILPGAVAMVYDLEQEALRCLRERSLDWPEPVLNEINFQNLCVNTKKIELPDS
jgi:HD superfamily phosphodiesterase